MNQAHVSRRASRVLNQRLAPLAVTAVLLVAMLSGPSVYAAPATPVPPTATTVALSGTAQPAKSVSGAPTSLGGSGAKVDPTKVAPAPPNPKTNPREALLYASKPGRMKSATFTYDMSTTMKPADDASAKALGAVADQLSKASQKMTGDGALEIVDAKKNLSNLRMTMVITQGDQTTKAEMVVIGNTSWMCISGHECVKLPARQNAGVDPAEALKLLARAGKATWVDSKPLKGEQVHHLRYALDKQAMESLIPAATRKVWQQVFGNPEMAGTLDVWLTAKDLQVRQLAENISVTMAFPDAPNAKIRADVAMTMRYDKINQPVKIVAPK